ncbi:ROK family protein [Jatrophihabitans fulvus]
MRTGSLESLRDRNRQAVVSAVQSRPACSRADVARLTGLSTTTVSTLVAELVADGVLVERGATRSGTTGGRPAVALGMNPAAGAVLGIHLGHAGTRVVVTGLDGTVYAERAQQADVDHQPARSLDAVVATAQELIDTTDVARVLDVGVAVSAPVLDARTLGSPPMLLDWAEIDIRAILRERLGRPVHIGNDATQGALAEWRLGAGAGSDDLLYVMLSDGVGAGLVLGGRLHHGATGAAGEFGHVQVVPDGHICRCGHRGCLETVVGARALVTGLAHARGPHCTLEDLLRLVASGDPGARRLLADAGRAIGYALAGFCTMLDPRLVVLGGDLAAAPAAGSVLVESVRTALDRALPPVGNHEIEVVPAQLGSRAEALGAALLAASAASAASAAAAR